MKLSIRMILLTTITIFVLLTICLSFVFVSSYNTTIKEIKEKTLVLIKTYESLIYLGYHKENAKGINEVFQENVDAIKTNMNGIIEINIYKLDDNPLAVATTDPSMIGKWVDREDIQAAEENKPVIILQEENNIKIIDVTHPLHYKGNIDYVIGIKVDMTDEDKTIFDLLVQTIITGFTVFVTGTIVIIIFSKWIIESNRKK